MSAAAIMAVKGTFTGNWPLTVTHSHLIRCKLPLSIILMTYKLRDDTRP